MPRPRSTRVRLKESDVFDPTARVQSVQEPDRDFGREPEREVVCYTLFGQHDYLDENDMPCLFDGDVPAEESDFAYAKSVTVGGRTRFFVKRGDHGRLLNPIGMADEWTHRNFRNKTGKKQWNFMEVNERVFTFYVRFLKSKNTAHHMNAEREAI